MRATTAAEMMRELPNKLATASTDETLQKWVQVAVGELGQAMVQSKSPNGVPYKPLKRKRPKGHNQRSGPLIDTGEMMMSLVGEGPGHIEVYSQGQVRLGTSNFKAIFHQEGTSKIPARPFVGFTPNMISAAADAAADFAMQALFR